MNSQINPKREIFIGVVNECPDVRKLGNFAYHVFSKANNKTEDFCYWVKTREDLTSILGNLNDAILVNGIPSFLTDHSAPEYRFRKLPSEDLEIILRYLEEKYAQV